MALALVALPSPPARGHLRSEREALLVRLRGPADAGALQRLEARTGGRVERVIPALRLVRLVPPAGGQGGAAAAARALAAGGEIASVRPDGRGRGGFVPDDPGFPLQWHLENTGQGGGLPGADLGAPAAWDRSRGSDAVVVAILDTGVDRDDPDLAGRLLPGIDLVNGDGDPSADHPHGTQVARLFGANVGNGVQVAGVDPAARILPVKVLDAANEGWESDLIAGLVWAADAGADVISMSLVDYPADSPDLAAALQRARDAGAVLVACAGNGGTGNADVSGPGAYPETISVGWTDAADALGASGGSASATGAALDLVAPGTSLVWALDGSGAPFLFSGCSAATPLVAGVASLLLALDPGLGHEGVARVLAASAADGVGPPAEDLPGRDDAFGHGRVDAAAALAMVPEPSFAPGAALAALAALGGRRRGRR
ncbi:MAG: S8 family serine peptidase [Deltaproteobacteria bacterium]|nr:S8 family serine peptidase [Deltaproteobacteria bacterium]